MFDFVLLISILLLRVMTNTLPCPEISAWSSVEVYEDRTVSFQCTVPETVLTPVKWTWNCAGKSMSNSIDNGRSSNLTFIAHREHDNTKCYCKAQSDSKNASYNKISDRQTITVFYQPRDNPKLTAESSTSLAVGNNFIFICRISTMGNPPISWSWKCGDRILSLGRRTDNGISSKIEFAVEPWQNGKSCFCEITSTKYNYNRPSNEQNVSVYYAPVDFPQLINKTHVHVDENSPVVLHCHVSSSGNPRLYWSWYCGEHLMEKEASYGDKWSELTFIASKQFHQRACYCRLRSKSDLVVYDKISLKKFITIKSGDTYFSVATFVTTTCLLSAALVTISLIILVKTVRNKPPNKQRWIPVYFRNLFRNSRCTAPPQPNVSKAPQRVQGCNKGGNEQFLVESEKRRKILYPVMRQAKENQQKPKLVRDVLYIDEKVYPPPNPLITELKDTATRTDPGKSSQQPVNTDESTVPKRPRTGSTSDRTYD